MSINNEHIKKLQPESILGIILAALGIFVLAGWSLRVPEMVRIVPGSVAMGFNAALCFLAAGICLVLRSFPSKRNEQLGFLLACVLIILPSAILFEHLYDIDLGIDLVSLHQSVKDGNPRPGRVSPNASLAFLMTGLVFLLMRGRPKYKFVARLITTLSYAVILLGVGGLLGYWLQLEWLYQWYRFNRMAVPTAVGISLLGIALWVSSRTDRSAGLHPFRSADHRILALSTTVLIVFAFALGLTGFIFVKQAVQEVLNENLMQTARNSRALFEIILKQNVLMTHTIANRPGIFKNLQILNVNSHDPTALASLTEIENSFLSLGFSGITIYSKNGQALGSVGHFSQRPALSVKLLGQRGEINLLWDKGFVLHSKVEMVKNGERWGTVVTEQRQQTLTETFAETAKMGRTGEYEICARSVTLDCFPSRLVPTIHHFPFFKNGQPAFPVARAILGQSGVMNVGDFRTKNVLAAYTPLGTSGLGLVVKMDSEEVYAPLRRKLAILLGLFTLFVLTSIYLLRTYIKPLASKLVLSEKESRLKSDALTQAVISLEEVSKELKISEERNRIIVESANDAFVGMDAQGLITDWNPQAEQIFCWKKAEVIGLLLEEIIIPPQFREAHRTGLAHFLETGVGPVLNKRIVLSAMKRDGAEFPVELTISVIRQGEVVRFASFLHDITERRKNEHRLTYLAEYDTLTGLPNRALFLDRLEGALLRSQRNKMAMALFFLDMDRFKNINDSLGHNAGDMLLKGLAERLKQAVRKTDTVSRLAGDEFTIILEGLVDPVVDARAIALKIIRILKEPFTLAGEQITASISMGIFIYRDGEISVDEIIRRADTAMYLAKEQGGNGFSFYSG